MRRLFPSLLAAFVAIAVTVGPALAIWPTTCVEANDSFEYAAARYGNVGIYQRVYGNAQAAESACRRDHHADIRAAFWWAVQGVDREPPTQPTPPPTQPSPVPVAPPAAVPAPVVCLHMDRDPNFTRSADCPYVGIDEGLLEAYKLMGRVDIPKWLASFGLNHWDADGSHINTVWIRWADIPDRRDFRTYADYDGYRNIRVSDRLRGLPDAALAALIAHELSHASARTGNSFNDCVWSETLAFVTAAVVWAALGGSHSGSDYEQALFKLVEVIDRQTAQPGWRGNGDKDLSEWHLLTSHVLYDRGYDDQCSW